MTGLLTKILKKTVKLPHKAILNKCNININEVNRNSQKRSRGIKKNRMESLEVKGKTVQRTSSEDQRSTRMVEMGGLGVEWHQISYPKP
jgi:hypothetical protein